jgi:hypothetical protein
MTLIIVRSTSAQTTVTPDSAFHLCSTVQYADSQFISKIEVFQAVEDGLIYVWEYDTPTNVVVERLAVLEEQLCFQSVNDPVVLGIEAASESLKGPQTGQNWHVWVDNRSAELQSCASDMTTAQGFDFNSLGVNTQNAAIARMQECIERNSTVQDIVIRRLRDLLVERGIIPPPLP